MMKKRNLKFDTLTYPQVLSHTSLAYMKKQPEYYGAKYMGDLFQGLSLCEKLVKPALIDTLKNLSDHFENVFLVPVIQKESNFFNMIPLAYAMVLRGSLKFQIVKKIKRCVGLANTGLSLRQRKDNKIEFCGEIPDINGGYIIVDDHFTTGATVRELSNHIIRQGGRVLAVTCLSCGRFGKSFIKKKNGEFIGLTGVEYLAERLYSRKKSHFP